MEMLLLMQTVLARSTRMEQYTCASTIKHLCLIMRVYGPHKYYNLSRVPNFCRVIYMSKKINIHHLFMNLDAILAPVKPWYWGNVYLHGYTTTTRMTLCGDANSWEVHECLARGEASLPNTLLWTIPPCTLGNCGMWEFCCSSVLWKLTRMTEWLSLFRKAPKSWHCIILLC